MKRISNVRIDIGRILAVLITISIELGGLLLCELLRNPIPSLISFIAVAVYLMFRYTDHVIKYSFIYFSIVGNVLGVFICEYSNVALYELSDISYYAGSLPLIIIIHTVFLYTLFLFDNDNIGLVSNHVNKQKIKYALIVLTAFAAIDFLLAASNPYYASDADRFEYVSMGFTQQIAAKLLNTLMYCIPIAAMGISVGYKKIAIVFIALFCSAAYMTGNKFGIYIFVLYVIMLGFYNAIKNLDKIKLLKITGVLLLVLSMLVGVVFYQNSVLYGYSFDRNMEFFEQRIAQQGQLWWKTYSLIDSGVTSSSRDIEGELESWFSDENNPAEGSYGIYKIMKMDTADQNLFYKKIQANSSYAYSTQASIYYYSGIAGSLLFAAISALIYMLIIKRLIKVIQEGRLLESIILTRFLVLIHGVLRQSEFYSLFSWRTFVYILIYVLVVYFTSDRRSYRASSLKNAAVQ